MHQRLHCLSRCPQSRLREDLRRRRLPVHIHIHPVGPHVVLKIRELRVHGAIASVLFRIHVFEFVQNNVEGFLHRRNMRDLHPVGAPAGLYPEIGVDKAE